MHGDGACPKAHYSLVVKNHVAGERLRELADLPLSRVGDFACA